MAQCIKHTDIGLQPWKNRGEEKQQTKGPHDSFRIRIFKEVLARLRKLGNRITEKIGIIITGPLRGETGQRVSEL